MIALWNRFRPICGQLCTVCLLLASLFFGDPGANAEAASSTAPAADFRQVVEPRAWAFPVDHGRHDGYKTEWWYFSGNLRDTTGRRFGYQLTFFRIALAPVPLNPLAIATRPSMWALHDLYFAHAAISDIQAKNFVFKDRMQRGQAGMAESSDRTLDVNLRDWRSKLDDQGHTILMAKDNGFGIDLIARGGVGPVLQGPGGVNAKGINPGQASYYYSEPLMPTHGTLRIDSQSFTVDGFTWMDHEFSSNPMSPTQVGWDWLALSFPDRSSLMVYRLRNQTGAADYISGTVISPTGQPKYLSASDIKMEGSQPWRSLKTGAQYPQQWRLTVPNREPILVRTLMTGQELITPATTDVNYFEGAVEATDESGNNSGEGYLEMTGYARSNRSTLETLLKSMNFARDLLLTP